MFSINRNANRFEVSINWKMVCRFLWIYVEVRRRNGNPDPRGTVAFKMRNGADDLGTATPRPAADPAAAWQSCRRYLASTPTPASAASTDAWGVRLWLHRTTGPAPRTRDRPGRASASQPGVRRPGRRLCSGGLGDSAALPELKQPQVGVTACFRLASAGSWLLNF